MAYSVGVGGERVGYMYMVPAALGPGLFADSKAS